MGCGSLPTRSKEIPGRNDVTLGTGVSLAINMKEQKREEWSLIEMVTETLYYESEGGGLSRKSIRNLKLKIKSKIEREGEGAYLKIRNTTLEKEGNENLHAFGFPELGETITLKLDTFGRVLDVEGYPKNSIFYLPPALLPNHAVKIGNSWSETFIWQGEGQPSPLKTKIECRLLGEEIWQRTKVFKIEMIAISELGKESESVSLESRSKGYFLWDNKKGAVVFSKSLGKDTIVSKKTGEKFVTHTQYSSKTLDKAP